MSDLLQTLELPINNGSNRLPLAMEFRVDPIAAPFLVSSTRALVWVPEAFGDVVRAAVRRNVRKNGEFYREVVAEIASQGTTSQWGNVFPYSLKGIGAAIQYLKSFEIEELELLIRAKSKMADRLRETFKDQKVTEVQWLPGSHVVVVPTDKELLGFVSRIGSSSIISVVHNPSRGMAIAKR